jgi:hypothetical protein
MENMVQEGKKDGVTCLRFSYYMKNKIVDMKDVIHNNFGIYLNQPDVLDSIFTMLEKDEFFNNINDVMIKVPTTNTKLTTFVISNGTKHTYDKIIRRFEKIKIDKTPNGEYLILNYDDSNEDGYKYSFNTDEWVQIIVSLFKYRNNSLIKQDKKDQLFNEHKQVFESYIK